MLLIFEYLKNHIILQFKIKIFYGINKIIIIYKLFFQIWLINFKTWKESYFIILIIVIILCFNKDKVLNFKK